MIICTILVNINLYMLSFLFSEVDESTAINEVKRCGGLIVKHNLMIILLMSIILLVGCQLNKKADTEGEKSAKSAEPKYMETEDYQIGRASCRERVKISDDDEVLEAEKR